MARTDAAIDRDAAVRRIAEGLGIRGTRGLRQAIVSESVQRVHDWHARYGITPSTLDEAQRLILNRTGLKIERLQGDEDIGRLAGLYRSDHPALPVQLQFEFMGDTEALVVQRKDDGRSASQFLAIVDARGHRRRRAWFAERHEPAHIIIGDTPGAVVRRRTQVEKPVPLEQVVDSVAAAVGFWEPIVRPTLRLCLTQTRSILDAFALAREMLAPEASVEASYRSFAALCGLPVVLLSTDYAPRREDSRPGGNPRKSMALRAVTVIPTAAADAVGMQIWNNFRIPPDSVIAQAYASSGFGTFDETDDLGRWTSESGRSLRSCSVRVVAQGRWAALVAT